MDINIPMENVPLTVLPIPAIHQGCRLRFYCDNPLQRDVYIMTDRKLTGPYISGEKSNTSIGFWEQLFFTHESMLLCVNKSQMRMEVPVSVNPLMVVLPEGSVLVNLACKANIGFRVDDSAAMLDDYCNCLFTSVEALIRGTICRYIQTTLTNIIPTIALSTPLPLVLSNLQKIAVSMAHDATRHMNATLHWLQINYLDLTLTCTNMEEITKAIQTPVSNLAPEVVPLLQAVLSNPALTVDQAIQILDRLCPSPYKYDLKQLQQAAPNMRYLA